MEKKRKPTASAPAKPPDLDIARVRGTVFEWLGIEDWMPELKSGGYTDFYSKRSRQRRLPHGTRDFPKWAIRAFPTGGPEFFAVDTVNRKILVGDITANPATTTQIRIGGLRKLPHGIGGWEGRHHLEKTVEYAEQLAYNLPEELKDCEVVAQDRYRESESHLKVSREVPVYRNGKFLRPSAAKRFSSYIDDAARGISSANQAVANRLESVSAIAGKKGILGATSVAPKAKSLTIGIKAWKVVRSVGRVAVWCLKVLDKLLPGGFLLDIALALLEREREKEERKRREKQKALEAVFKLENNITAGQFRFDKKLEEETKVQSLIQSKILNNAALFDEFVQDWDNNRKFMGFLYARVNAELHIEGYRDLMTNKDTEAFTTYTVTSLEVNSTSWAHDFDWTEIGEEKEVKKTESDIKRLIENGVLYPEFFKKLVKRKRLKYTLVPPLFTPFDIVVTKINNLFLDMVIVIDSFHRTGGIANFTGFNYKCSWNEQFSVALEFPHPLNESTCRYCLSYLHWAAGTLSQHPLAAQDLEGNLEDPRKGWRRRFGLLMRLLEGQDTRDKKNFSFVAGRIKELVKGSGKSEEVVSALEELYMGARAIWYDLERIEANISKTQYYYFGPSYQKPA
jgi:hypothetical protein